MKTMVIVALIVLSAAASVRGEPAQTAAPNPNQQGMPWFAQPQETMAIWHSGRAAAQEMPRGLVSGPVLGHRRVGAHRHLGGLHAVLRLLLTVAALTRVAYRSALLAQGEAAAGHAAKPLSKPTTY